MGGSLTESELKEYMKYLPILFKYFIEGGTYKADSTKVASRLFEQVHTVEIAEDLYTQAKENCTKEGYTNITFYLGDTVKIFPEIIKKVDGPAVWFLDAHQSGCDTKNNGKWVPLIDELKCICRDYKHPGIIIIDDLRLWSNVWDWIDVSVESVLNIFEEYGVKIKAHFANNDRYLLYL